jgi:hypothetical protein
MDISDVWLSARRKAQRLDLKDTDSDMRMSITEMLAFISTCYARKCVADHLDDREGAPRLPLSEFVYYMVLEDLQDTKKASQHMCRIVANILMYCSLGNAI